MLTYASLAKGVSKTPPPHPHTHTHIPSTLPLAHSHLQQFRKTIYNSTMTDTSRHLQKITMIHSVLRKKQVFPTGQTHLHWFVQRLLHDEGVKKIRMKLFAL